MNRYVKNKIERMLLLYTTTMFYNTFIYFYNSADQANSLSELGIFEWAQLVLRRSILIRTEAEFKELKPCRWNAKNRFQLSADSIAKHWIQFQVEPTRFEMRLKLESRLKFFKFGLRRISLTGHTIVYHS